ncbi:LysM peptidoglycan-binding domain-containing protein [Nocardioides hungaricus]
MTLIATAAWIAWTFVAVSVVLEVVSQVRGLPAPTLPGLGTPQRAVGQLVTVAALLFVATPTVVAALPSPPAHAATTATAHEPARLAVVEGPPALPDAPPVPPRQDPTWAPVEPTSTINYTVKRGDSLWKIAERLLGDGTRFRDIFNLNTDALDRPDFITPGTVLKVPHEATHSNPNSTAGEYVVQPGDTLSAIADARLGDPTRYPELIDASRDTVQPDGATLTDPNLIRPGWKITIPGQAKHKAKTPQQPEARPNDIDPPKDIEPPAEPPSAEPTPEPAEPPSAEPTPEPTATSRPDPGTNTADDANDQDDAGDEATAPGWLVAGLTGSGALLAGFVLLAVRAHRNTQLRYRRPGQSIAPPPEELRAIEKTALVSGAPLTQTIANLDLALRHLAGECADSGRPLPQLATATLANSAVTLQLDETNTLPAPWTGAGREWSLPLSNPQPERNDVLPPYPLLVSVGQDDDGLRLVNLEHLGVVSLVGDPQHAEALARHIAAELTLNPWSTTVEVNVIGLGEELAALDTTRLRHHADGGQIVAGLVRDVTTSLETNCDDPDPYRAVITTGDGTAQLATLLVAPPSRIGTALVSLAAPAPESTVFELNYAGRLRAPVLGLDVQAAGLTSEEATACAAIVDLTRESAPVTIPSFEPAAGGWRALADQAGALREELTHVRDDGPAGDGSLLPEAAEEYVATAATTVADIATLAPVVSEQIRRTLEEADPTLDEDVADWFDAEVPRPRLTLLGPVNAEVFGAVKPVILKRRPYFVEILAYLALHPNGATANEVADAFGIAASRARTDVSSLRDWLGSNPRTEAPYLPAANESPTYLESGVKTYQVQDVLVDLDLFRRLRARGEARGAEGIQDLTTAMSLVHGPPFSLLRAKGWSWLLDTERIHETVDCAIVDTAHLLVVNALAKGNMGLAREIAETACKAAPYDDICRLDLVKVAAAEGHEEVADKMLADNVFNRTDDYLPPIDLPDRTAKVVKNNGWAGRPRSRD